MLENMIKHWNEKAKRDDPVVLVVIGKPGVGKSTLLNNFLDLKKRKRAVAAHYGESVTTEVSEYIQEVNGIKVKIIDTPGLGSADLTEDQVKRQIAMLNAYTDDGKADLLLYCCSMDGGRIDSADVKTIETLNRAFKGTGAIWERALLVLTHADTIIDQLESDSDSDSDSGGEAEDGSNKSVKPTLEQVMDSYCKSFLNTLKKAGVTSVKEVRNGMSIKSDELDPSILIAMPAGKKPKKPTDWVPMLFREVLKRCSEDAIPALFQIRGIAWMKIAYFVTSPTVRMILDGVGAVFLATTAVAVEMLPYNPFVRMFHKIAEEGRASAQDYVRILHARAEVSQIRKKKEVKGNLKVVKASSQV